MWQTLCSLLGFHGLPSLKRLDFMQEAGRSEDAPAPLKAVLVWGGCNLCSLSQGKRGCAPAFNLQCDSLWE